MNGQLRLALAGIIFFAPAAIAQANGFAVRVQNTLPIARPDETIGLRWSDVRTHIPNAPWAPCVSARAPATKSYRRWSTTTATERWTS